LSSAPRIALLRESDPILLPGDLPSAGQNPVKALQREQALGNMSFSLMIFLVGLAMVLLQSTVLHVLPVVPDLILIICVYWGLHQPTAGAVLGAFALGYSVDIVASPILGLNAFAMTVVFFAVYLSSRSIWLQGPIASTLVVLVAALIKGAALMLAWAIFLDTESFWLGALRYMIFDALFAAAIAPLVFAVLRRGQRYLETLRVWPSKEIR
jgi:rod shape-determining protein MreD